MHKSEPSPILIAEHLTVGYGNHAILHDINIAWQPGEIVALLGPNGSGKSTLLRTLLGILHPISGQINICGHKASSLHARECAKFLAYVPQTESTPFPFTGREVAMMGRIVHSESFFESKADHEYVQEALARADALDFADRPIQTLSGGEYQRVLIARALAQDAPLILLDEPTSHLDPKHQLSLGELLRDLARAGRAIVIATHDLIWAGRFADKAILLGAGGTVQMRPVGEVLQSEELSMIYGTEFLQMRVGDDDRIIVIPKLS